MHLIAKDTHGSSNPLGITGNIDRIPMHPYFIFKDLITVFVFLLIYSVMVFYYPNLLGDVEN
jgi:ubiquinol-cytochrome c reductase cytochrome b subunit